MEKGWSDDGAESNGGWVNGQIEPCASMWAEQTDPQYSTTLSAFFF